MMQPELDENKSKIDENWFYVQMKDECKKN